MPPGRLTPLIFCKKCRTFGAHLIHLAYPGLTAGPIECRPFGPDTGVACVMIWNAHAGFAQASTSTFDIHYSTFDILFLSA
jgi:hypothetical protein